MALLKATVLLLTVSASPAQAQRYVGGSFGVAVITESEPDGNGDGTTTAFAFRTGRLYASGWGVDVELTHAFRFDGQLPPSSAANGFSIEDRHTTLTVAAWRRQMLTERWSLGYVFGGGVTAFQRDVFLRDPGQSPPEARRVEDVLSIVLTPVVGLDARVALTEHVQLVPSLRLYLPALDHVIIQPMVGLQWAF